MIDIRSKMIQAFREANGGLFSNVEKADVGNSYQELEKQGVALMGMGRLIYAGFFFAGI